MSGGLKNFLPDEQTLKKSLDLNEAAAKQKYALEDRRLKDALENVGLEAPATSEASFKPEAEATAKELPAKPLDPREMPTQPRLRRMEGLEPVVLPSPATGGVVPDAAGQKPRPRSWTQTHPRLVPLLAVVAVATPLTFYLALSAFFGGKKGGPETTQSSRATAATTQATTPTATTSVDAPLEPSTQPDSAPTASAAKTAPAKKPAQEKPVPPPKGKSLPFAPED